LTTLNFEVTNASIINEEDKQFAIARIHAFSSGDNLHDLTCSKEVLMRTARTLWEKPIVFDYDSTWADFGGHVEEPLIAGFVVPNSEEFVELEDGRTGLYVLAKIWKRYSGKFMSIFQSDNSDTRKVSVEMDITALDDSMEPYEMMDFSYTAICVLGTFVDEASPGAHLQIVSFSKEKDKDLYFENFSRYDDIDFSIPNPVKKNAKSGLELRSKYSRGGTSVSLAVARHLIKNDISSPEKIRQMNKYFSRNTKDGLNDKTSGEWISWLLWGGSSGESWSKEIIEKMNEADEKLSVYFQEEETTPPEEFTNKEKEELDFMEKKTKKEIEDIAKTFSLNSSQVIEVLNNSLSGFKYGDDKYRKYWAVSFDDKLAYIHDSEDGKSYGVLYTIDGESVSLDMDTKKEVDGDSFESIFSYEDEEKKEKEDMAESEDDEESDDEESDDEEPSEEEMAAQNSYKRVGEVLSMLEGEEGHGDMMTSYADKQFDVMGVLDMACGKLSKMEEEAKTHMSELEELRKYKADVEESRMNYEVDTTLKRAETHIPDEELSELREKSKEFSLDNIDVWKNLVYAKAFALSEGNEENEEGDKFIRYPIVNNGGVSGGKKGIWDD